MSIERRVNFNVVPADGYFFKDPSGPTFHGHTWPEVVARLKHYRRRNRLPLGDPANEVADQALARNPHLLRPATTPRVPGRPKPYNRSGAVPVPKKPARVSLKAKTFTWLRAILRRKQEQNGELQFVAQDVQKARLSTCNGCPKKQEVPGGCASCSKAYAVLRSEVLDKRPFKKDQLSCAVLGADLQTMAWLDEVTIENGELPDTCWRKRTL